MQKRSSGLVNTLRRRLFTGKCIRKRLPQKQDLRGYIAYRMAECNRLINNTPRATSAYMNALRYDYPDSIVSLRLGQMYQKSGKYMDAIRHYNDFLLLNPESQLASTVSKGSELATMETKPEPLYR